MKIVKVTYTSNEQFVETNQSNIRTVMHDLQQLNHSGINYHVSLGPDGRTFMHLAFFQSDADQKLLTELPSFKSFQEQLKASRPETAPHQEHLTLVASSVNIFNQ